MRSGCCRWPGLTLSGVLLLAPVVAAAAEQGSLRGAPLTQAITLLEQRGLSVIYSTDLVKPWMRVAAEPMASEPERMLGEILAPFGLSARAGPNGVLLIVRTVAPGFAEPTTVGFRQRTPSPDSATPWPLANVIVTASPYQLTRGFSVSPVSMSGADIAKLPDLGDDALRAVARLPGTTANGLTAETHIRGGDANETLVRFDGLRLYNPFHLKDFQSVFSAIDPGIISSADVYTGGLPASYGDRMSGVIDITSLAPPGPRYHEVSLSFFNATALSSGEFGNGKGAWLGAIRRSNLDVWYHAFSKQSGTPTYLDAFAKLSYRLGENTRLTASALYIADDVTLAAEDGDERAAAEFADNYGWLRLDREVGDSLSGSVWLSHTRLASHRDGSSVQTGVSVGTLQDDRWFLIDALQTEWSWRARDRWLLEFGGEMARTTGRYEFRDEAQLAVLFDAPGAGDSEVRQHRIDIEPSGNRSSLYASVRYNATQRLTADFGLRSDRQSLDPTHGHPWSPRLALRYQLRPDTDLRASWGRAYQSQNIDELPVSDGVTQYIRPQRTDHSALGVEHRYANGIGLRAEIYDKHIVDPRPRYENLLNTLTLLPELKPDRVLIAPVRARARGLELFLQRKDSGPLTWWLGYSWSSVKDEIGGREVPRSWDQTHAVSAGLNWNRNKWDLGLAFIYRSGWPTTRVALDASGPIPVAVAGPQNARRVSSFASADLRVGRRFDLSRSSLSAFLEVSNFLGRANQCCTAYEIDDQTALLELERRDYLPLIPSLGVLWQF